MIDDINHIVLADTAILTRYLAMIDLNGVAWGKATSQERFAHGVLHLILNDTAQRSSSIVRIKAGLGNCHAGGISQDHLDLLLFQLHAQWLEFEFDDHSNFVAREAAEDHDPIQAIDKFGTE